MAGAAKGSHGGAPANAEIWATTIETAATATPGRMPRPIVAATAAQSATRAESAPSATIRASPSTTSCPGAPSPSASPARVSTPTSVSVTSTAQDRCTTSLADTIAERRTGRPKRAGAVPSANSRPTIHAAPTPNASTEAAAVTCVAARTSAFQSALRDLGPHLGQQLSTRLRGSGAAGRRDGRRDDRGHSERQQQPRRTQGGRRPRFARLDGQRRPEAVHDVTSSCTRAKNARSMSTPPGSSDPTIRPSAMTEIRSAMRATSSR